MTLRIAAVLFAALPLAAVAQDKPVTGAYNVHLDIAGNVRDFTCNFTQKDKVLEGGCTDLSEFSGSVDGATVKWHVKGEQASLNFVGKLAADGSIAGTVTAVEYAIDGDFKAVPAAK